MDVRGPRPQDVFAINQHDPGSELDEGRTLARTIELSAGTLMVLRPTHQTPTNPQNLAASHAPAARPAPLFPLTPRCCTQVPDRPQNPPKIS